MGQHPAFWETAHPQSVSLPAHPQSAPRQRRTLGRASWSSTSRGSQTWRLRDGPVSQTQRWRDSAGPPPRGRSWRSWGRGGRAGRVSSGLSFPLSGAMGWDTPVNVPVRDQALDGAGGPQPAPAPRATSWHWEFFFPWGNQLVTT